MNELSRIQFETAQENPSYVSGRMLHQALQIKTPYRKWFPRVCIQNEYEEGVDFITSDKKVLRADGVDAIREAVRELEASGYMTRSRVRNEKGQLRRFLTVPTCIAS